MKKSVFGLMMAATLVLSACGGKDAAPVKSEEDEIRESIMNDLTDEDKELINEMAKELGIDSNGDISGKTEEAAEEKPVEEPAKAYPDKHDPLPEILSAEFEDGKVQIGKDIILQLSTMTFEDVDRIISESEEAERYSWGEHNKYDDGRVVLKRDGEDFAMLAFNNMFTPSDPKVKFDDCKFSGLFDITSEDTIFAKGFRINGEPSHLENIETYFADYPHGNGQANGRKISYWKNVGYGSSAMDYTLFVKSHYAYKVIGQDVARALFVIYETRVDLGTGDCTDISFYTTTYDIDKYSGLNEDEFILLNDIVSAGTSGDTEKTDNNSQSEEATTESSQSVDDKSSVWGDVSVKEYTDDTYGIHFYLPEELEVKTKEPLYNKDIVSKAYYVTGMGMKDEFLCQVQKCTDEVNDNSDAPEDELHGEIAHKDGYHYSINFINPETQYDFTLSDAMVKFINDYRQKILDSAWVD